MAAPTSALKYADTAFTNRQRTVVDTGTLGRATLAPANRKKLPNVSGKWMLKRHSALCRVIDERTASQRPFIEINFL